MSLPQDALATSSNSFFSFLTYVGALWKGASVVKGVGGVGMGREVDACKHGTNVKAICLFLELLFFRITAFLSRKAGIPLSAVWDPHSL